MNTVQQQSRIGSGYVPEEGEQFFSRFVGPFAGASTIKN
jgi:hypothetical protein